MGSCIRRLALAGTLVIVGVLINGSTALALCPIDSPCCPGGCPPPKDDTHTSLVSNASPSAFGQSITFTATVTDTSDSTGTPNGSVTFKDGSVSLGTVALSGGHASLNTSTLSVASHSITASYPGNTAFFGSSGSTTQTVNPDPTSTSLSSSKNPSSAGDSVTLTATVVAPYDSPGGSVTFKDGSANLGSVPLSGGHAALTTSTLSAGSHSITASYSSDADNAPSSVGLTQTVNAAPSGSGGSGGGSGSGAGGSGSTSGSGSVSSAGASGSSGGSGSGGSGAGNSPVLKITKAKSPGLKCVKPARKRHGKAKAKSCTKTTHKKHRAGKKH